MSVDIFKLDSQDGKDLSSGSTQDMGLLETYRYLMEDVADPRVADWPLMGSPLPIMAVLLTYLFFVLRLGPFYMRNRKPYDLNNVMICYNVLVVIANAVVFYELFVTNSSTNNISFGCRPHIVSRDPESHRMATNVWRLLMLKIWELMDTIIFVLRKKNTQASFLHIYHHTSTTFLSWIACKFVPGGMWTLPIMLNCIVHVIMYTYYLLACFGPEMQKRIAPWKQYVTGLQMAQFVVMILHMSQTLFPSCEPNRKPVTYIYLFQVASVFYLFWDYYKKSYLRKKMK